MDLKSARFYSGENNESLKTLLGKNLPANSVLLDIENKYVKQYLNYCLILSDLRLAIDSIERLIEMRLDDNKKELSELYEDENLLLKRTLYISLLNNYAKCFNSKGVKLNIDFIKKNFPVEILSYNNTIDFHNKVIDVRNKFIAHRENHYLEEIIGFIEFQMKGNILESKIDHTLAAAYSFDEDELQNFFLLLSLLRKNTLEKIEEISNKIISEITNEGLIKMGIETLTKPKI